MDGLDRWDMVLLAGAALAAIWKLVSLMRTRRNRLVSEVQQQLELQRQTQQAAKTNEAA